jgi:hypothetical protein
MSLESDLTAKVFGVEVKKECGDAGRGGPDGIDGSFSAAIIREKHHRIRGNFRRIARKSLQVALGTPLEQNFT